MYRAIPKNSGLCQRRMTSDAQLLGILFVLGNMTFSINLWFAKRSQYKSILHTFLDLMERAFVRVESSLSGLDENFLNRLRNLPQMPTEEN